jgi:hypothetical protein
MANNYLQFSEQLENLTKNEADWIQARYTELADMLAGEDEDGNPVTRVWTDADEKYGWTAYSQDGGGLDFECEVSEQRDGTYSAWIHADEYGNPEQVGSFIEEFLATFNKDDEFTMTWAYTCSKPRIGEFGGGAMIVTKYGAEFGDALGLLRDSLK